MHKAQAPSVGVLGWVLLTPVLYYLSILPVVVGLNLCFGSHAHAPAPLISGISSFYYPWGLLADTFPVLGQPLDVLDKIQF